MYLKKKKEVASVLVFLMVFMLFAGSLPAMNNRVLAEKGGEENFAWQLSEGDGFGKGSPNYAAEEMVVYDGEVYVGVANYKDGAEVWKKNDHGWVQVNDSGFGNAQNMAVTSMAVYEGELYAGTLNMIDGAEFYRYNGESWTAVDDGFVGGSFSTGMNIAATAMEVHEGKLFAGVTNSKVDISIEDFPSLDDLPIGEIIEWINNFIQLSSKGGEIWPMTEWSGIW